ncbi:MAG: TonB-dependent receptor [candidate division Zixibacteria bacterium]|nr:TonB-dependent receptor [candidate division Zixibacteria bacterium]
MRFKFLTLIGVLSVLLASTAFGAVTGKITGQITDVETKEALIGVTVSVMGTNLGAITDLDGNYIILNVPVGDYVLSISAVGYATLEVSNVHVSADLATYQNHELSSRATDLGTTISVRAEAPLVIKDKTTTVDIVQRDELLAMPVRGFEQVVGIQNSVVRMNSNVDIRQRGNRESTSQAPEINLRGGRPSEVAYYVDGFSQQDPLTGISSANISNNAIKEISVTSGAFSAEYGHVASGIVNVTTNSGGEEYHANAEVVTDNAFKELGYDSFDQNWYAGDFSGPIPGTEKGFFFFSGERRWLADRTPSTRTKQVYEDFGLVDVYDLDNPQRMPYNSLSGWSYQGKIDYNFTPNFKFALSGNGSYDSWQEYRHYYMNPRYTNQVQHSPRYVDKNLGLNAKITHTLDPETFYNLSVSYFQTERIRGDGVLFDDYPGHVRELVNPTWDFYNIYREGDSLFASDYDPTIESGSEEDTFVTFYESYWDGYFERQSSYIQAKGDITRQMMAHHTVKFGFDFQRHTVRFFENLNASLGNLDTRTNRYGYDLEAEPSDVETFLNDTKHPINLGLYLTDRFDWRGMIISAGVRFDYFDYKALRLKNVSQPTDADNPDPEGGVDKVIDRSDLEDSEKFTRVSPRLGISFPVSDRTQLHINYGKFFQRPDLRNLYVGYNFLEARIDAGSYYAFPSPNLEPEKTTQYEVGITHQLGDFTAFNITAYYKDVTDLTQIFHQSPAYPTAYDFYSNTDYGTIKGVDFSVTMRRTRNIAMSVKYSLGYATGTGSYNQTQFNIAWKNSLGTPKQTNPLDYDQRHTLIGMFDLRTGKGEGPKIGEIYPLEDFGLFTIIQLASGTPYTPMEVYDGVSPNAAVQQIPTGTVNSANLPWQFVIDLKLERSFTISKYKLVPYLWVKNLLDRENVLNVYEGTGKADVSGYLQSAEGQVRASETAEDPETGLTRGEEFSYRYDLAQNNPKNYSNPRMILFGLRVSF